MPTPASSSSAPSTSSRRVPLDKRKRTETSCDKCKSRKQKCKKEPGQEACNYCIANRIACQTTQPRKKRLYGSVEGLGNRLAMLEALVKGFLPDADLSNVDEMRQLAISLNIEPPDTGDKDTNGEKDGSVTEEEDSHSLLHDEQGQVQYIGKASSFGFHLKLRALLGQSTIRKSVLFGKNAADRDMIEGQGGGHALPLPNAPLTMGHGSPIDHHIITALDPGTIDTLIETYFEHVNRDFPVLHEASFLETSSKWRAGTTPEPCWLCSFYCVLLLAHRPARLTVEEDVERRWWQRVQVLLPAVAFTSSVRAVQALMIAALYLHNTNHRDACWNLTGTAIRIAIAIGLHQDNVNATQNQLTREIRKQLWWTLYAFEQTQLSSYDRPSAIEHPAPKVDHPNEQTLGTDNYLPLHYNKWFNSLIMHLAFACRAPKHAGTSTSDETYVGALSPAAGVLRDLERWMGELPQSLKLDTADNCETAFQRPLLLLHALYHYTVTLLCRAALLARATTLSRTGRDSTNTALTMMADTCVKSGHSLAGILLKLDELGKFNNTTWYDCWYSLQSATILVLDLVCISKVSVSQYPPEPYEKLLKLADLTQRHCDDPHVPGTLRKFASIVPELLLMVNSMSSLNTTRSERLADCASTPNAELASPDPSAGAVAQMTPFGFHQSSTNSNSLVYVDNITGRYFPDIASLGDGVQFPDATYARNTQMSFLDYTLTNIQDWTWGDFGGMLGTESLPHSPGPSASHGQNPD